MADATDADKLKQHYQWWGLTCREMRPYLTEDEWDTLLAFSEKLAARYGGDGWTMGSDDIWPESRTDRWEARK